MSSEIRIVPLCDGNVFSFVLEIDATKILLDCGCSEDFDFGVYDANRTLLQELDCILVSHADLAYIGALPYIVEKFSLSCPIYATVPVHNMGLMSLYDVVQGLEEEGKAPASFSLDDVDACFDRIIRVRYMQTVQLGGAAKGVTVVAYAAGNSVGACLWRIGKNTEDVVYAVDFNHKKERHLDGINFEMLVKPSILITNSNSIFAVHKNRKQRDSDLVESSVATLRAGGSILIPVKGTTRVLELLLLLEQTWESQSLPYPIYFLSHQSYRVVEFAKSMLEWMGEGVIRGFGNTRVNPFQFKHVQLASSMEECAHQGPALFLAPSDSLCCGFSRQLFMRLAPNPSNLVVFVSDRTKYEQIKGTSEMEMELKQRVPLNEQELAAHRQQSAFQEERRKAEAAFDEILKKKLKTDQAYDWEEEEEEEQGNRMTLEDEKERLKMLYWYDYQYDLKLGKLADRKTGAVVPMFPCQEPRIKFDEYGETIQPEDLAALSISTDQEPATGATKKTVSKISEEKAEAVPFKWVSSKMRLPIACKMAFIDFEGLSDGRSIKTIIARISPRKLVLVNGTAVTRQYMSQFCKVSEEITNNITVANPGCSVNISSSLDIFTVRIDEALLQSLRVKSYAGYELAFVTGQVQQTNEQSTLVPLTSPQQEHEPLLLGNPKLSQLRKQLFAQGMAVELVAGQLRCGPISIKRNPNQPHSFLLEGPLCKEYYAVRDALYSQVVLL